MHGIFLSLQPFPARSQEQHGRGDPVLCVQTDAIYFGADHLLSIHRTLKHAADSSTDRGGVLRIKLARLGSSIVTMMLMDEWAILEAAAEMDRYIKGGGEAQPRGDYLRSSTTKIRLLMLAPFAARL
jgi:hypothetical protein